MGRGEIMRGLSWAMAVFFVTACGADNDKKDTPVQFGAAQWEGAYRLSRLGSTLGATHKKGGSDDFSEGTETVDLAKYRPDLAPSELALSIYGYKYTERATVKLSGAGSDQVRECTVRSGNWLDCPLRNQRVETEGNCQYWIAIQDTAEVRDGKLAFGRYYWLGPVGGKECIAKLQEDLPKKSATLPIWQSLFDTKAFAIDALPLIDSAALADLYRAEKQN